MQKRTTSGWRLALRAAAFLLLAVIAADLSADGSCFATGSPAAGLAWSPAGGASGDADPCAAGCVPDCFCCSTGEAHGLLALDAPDASCAELAAESPLAASLGARRLPYIPPLARS